ncbi:MAG: DNA polymerase III subunit delta' [Roseovarius sp.]|nr:DNA polymerase III subunit delta' [Roseovarius sp.]
MIEGPAQEPDRIYGAPHPRETIRLYGQKKAETVLLEAFLSGKMHHGWLLNGPAGIGKATLAWRMARFLLATPVNDGAGKPEDPPQCPDSLDISPDHPVSRRVAAGTDPGMYVIRRRVNENSGRLQDQIVADSVRDLNRFLGLSAADGGRRVVIVDSADDMNEQAANALLKMLEEPPRRTTFFLISHKPSKLLPTIRSRCLNLRLEMLDAENVSRALAQAGLNIGDGKQALYELSGGSVGKALRLTNLGGLDLYAEVVALAGSFPGLDRARSLKLAESVSVRGEEERLELLYILFDLFLSRLARFGATGQSAAEAVPGETEVFARLSPSLAMAQRWADCALQIGARASEGMEVNLDPMSMVLDTVFLMRDAAGARK